MISLAARRYLGLAIRPALFLCALLTFATLTACRDASEWHYFEGVALDTGYHITLNADLDAGEREPLWAAIQGELASLDSAVALGKRLQALRLPGMSTAWRTEFEPLMRRQHARAVDRLDALLAEFGIADAMIELGGVVRTRGSADGERPWRLALDRTGLPEAGVKLRLRDAALVTLYAESTVDLDDGRRILAVSAVAPSAERADREARRLLVQGDAPMKDNEHAVSWVVLTPQGIEIHYSDALEALLER